MGEEGKRMLSRHQISNQISYLNARISFYTIHKSNQVKRSTRFRVLRTSGEEEGDGSVARISRVHTKHLALVI